MSEAKRLLIVEDDEGISGMFRTILESENYEILTVDDGGQVVATVASYQPDAILLDMMLPTLNGVEVLKALALLDSRPPVLVISAYTDQGPGERAVAPWPDTFYLAKPVDLDGLLTAVAALFTPAPDGESDQP